MSDGIGLGLGIGILAGMALTNRRRDEHREYSKPKSKATCRHQGRHRKNSNLLFS